MKKKLKKFVEELENNPYYQAFQKDHIPRCLKCGKKYVNAADSITGKFSKYLWKGNCEHVPKGWRLSVG